jgi:hypothetical protein
VEVLLRSTPRINCLCPAVEVLLEALREEMKFVSKGSPVLRAPRSHLKSSSSLHFDRNVAKTPLQAEEGY